MKQMDNLLLPHIQPAIRLATDLPLCLWRGFDDRPFDFVIMDRKLYLFPAADYGGSTKDAWWRVDRGPKYRIEAADKQWPKFKAELEAK